MKKILGLLLFMAALTALTAFPALAETAAETAGPSAGAMRYFIIIVSLATGAMVVVAVLIGFSQSKTIRTGLEGIARNPAAAGKILPTLVIGLAMMEALAIYVLVISLILLFTTPFIDLIG